MKALGRQLLVELYDCDRNMINDAQKIESIMTKSAVDMGATIVSVSFHTFNPHGVSGVVVIAESHLAIHTWPEYGFASIDIYTCGDTVDPWKACDDISTKLKAKHVSALEMKRGVLNIPGQKIRHKPFSVTQDKEMVGA
ncbi:MAG: adenosylmethionine decarboxylase [bacterium]